MIGKPQIKDAALDTLIAQHLTIPEPPVLIVGMRGYYANTFGVPGRNDWNLYDDALIVRERGDIVGRFNANTDPSVRPGRAQLPPGLYTFYKGKHKSRIDALRAHPEGVTWKCKRMVKGQLVDSTCSHINIHDGGLTNTWSEGCQSIPGRKAARVWGNQYGAFIEQVYRLMQQHNQQVVHYLLVEVNP